MMTSASPNPPNRPLGQLSMRHLLGLVTLAAVPCALAAPLIRSLDAGAQRRALLDFLIVLVVALGIAFVLARGRRKVEMLAGPLLLRCERRSSRVLKWFLAVAVCGGYVSSIFAQQVGHHPWYVFPGNPWILYVAVSYWVIRIWWNLDPTALEVCERGFVQGGFNFQLWTAIKRYTWSGDPPRQLNLYYKHSVVNLKIDQAYIERLKPILADKINGEPTSAETPAAAT